VPGRLELDKLVPGKREPGTPEPDRQVPGRQELGRSGCKRQVPDKQVPDRQVPDRKSPDTAACNRNFAGQHRKAHIPGSWSGAYIPDSFGSFDNWDKKAGRMAGRLVRRRVLGNHKPGLGILRMRELDKPGLDRTVPDKTGLDRTVPDKTELGRTVPDKTGLGRMVPDKMGLGRPELNKLELGNRTIPESKRRP